jgi:tetratricopeptide (TPR) repeat protein
MKMSKTTEMTNSLGLILSALALVISLNSNASAASPYQAPLLRGMGSHTHPVTTHSDKAQRYFNQGIVMLHGFNHAKAIRSFRTATELDPDCAMAWWGIAYAEGPNINASMAPEAYPRAWAALQKALSLKPKVSDQEKAYIDALTARYQEKYVEDRSALDLAYLEEARRVAHAYPDDMDAKTILCESIMNTMPWNYWTPDRKPHELTKELLATLQVILRRNPEHPGANHFYIHAVEAGPSPESGIPSADRLRSIAPAAGHLVHMPSHIYVRVGQYDEAVEANEKAVKADQSYLRQCREQGVYAGGYYPHNIHFLWYANSLRGNSREAIKAARKVSDYTLDLRCGAEAGGVQRYMEILALTQFGQWKKVLDQKLPGQDYPFDQGMYHFARCLAYLGMNDLPLAQDEYGAFKSAFTPTVVSEVTPTHFPAGQVVEVLDHVLQGKIALYQGDEENSIKHLSAAVDKEELVEYMEPPYVYYSVRWSLGAAHLRLGQYEEAEKVFRKDLEWLPRNGWSLYGLAMALRNQGKTTAADSVYDAFKIAWKNADVKPDLTLY